MRQVHAERRSRYATAVEQLADDKAPIRLGGVYTLVKLVDKWLADEKTISKEGERREEGQVIINSLCAYIRSPFGLASKTKVLSDPKAPENCEGGDQQLVKDRASFREEKELRLAILEAIKTRLNGGARIHKDGTRETLKGLWSDFNYDFSNTVFFYPTDFSSSLFGASSNFFKTTFTQGVTFSTVKFTRGTNFFEAKFTKDADFSGADFAGFANFSEAEFITGVNFFRSVDFPAAKFTKSANFSKATFEDKPRFEYTLDNKTCKARFSCKANPEDYNFEVSHDSPYKIETEEQEHNGVKFIIPKGTELFEPRRTFRAEVP